MRTLSFPLVPSVLLALVAVSPVMAQAPDAVWQHHTAGAAYYAVASDTKRVYAVGRADSPATGGHDFLIDAFDPSTGVPLWHTQWDDVGWHNDESAGMWSAEPYTATNQLRNDLVEVSGGRLYVGGASCHPNVPCTIDRATDDPNHMPESTLLAFNASNGAFLWRRSGGGGGVLAMTTGGGRIFTADAAHIQAWDDAGTLLWLDVVDGRPSALHYDGGKLFVAYDGFVDAAPNAVAYDPATGIPIWTQPGAAHDWVDAMTSGMGNRLIAAGRHDAPDGSPWVRIQSSSQATGAVQWTAPLAADRAMLRGEAIDVVANASRVFAAGIRIPTSIDVGTGFFVRAHDVASGTLVWKDEPDLGQYAAAYAVRHLTGLNRPQDVPSRIGTSLVVVAGFGTDAVGDGFGVLRAYEPKTGQLVWQHTYATIDRRDELLSLAKAGRHVVAVGTATPNLSWKWGKTPKAGFPDMAEAVVAAFE